MRTLRNIYFECHILRIMLMIGLGTVGTLRLSREKERQK